MRVKENHRAKCNPPLFNQRNNRGSGPFGESDEAQHEEEENAHVPELHSGSRARLGQMMSEWFLTEWGIV